MLGKRKGNERGCIIVQAIKSKETFVRNTTKVCDAEVKIEKRLPTFVWNGLFRTREQRLLVRGFTDRIAMVPGPAGGLWARSVRVDGVHHVDGLKHGAVHFSSFARPCLTFYLVSPSFPFY